MILIQLLRANQTLVMGKPLRYRETGLVPRFETAGPAVSRAGNNRAAAVAAEASHRATDNSTTTAMNTQTTKNAGTRLAKPWTVLLACLERWRAKRRAAGAKTAGRKPARAVQQELLLQNVQVCRNDLSDADWDVVEPPKSGARLAFIRQLASTGTTTSKRNRMAPRAEATGRL